MVVGVVVLAIVGVRVQGVGERWIPATGCSRLIAIPLLAAARDRLRARTSARTSCAGSASLSAPRCSPSRSTSSSPTRSSSGEEYQFFIRWDWLENVGFLGENGITLHLGIDGIAAPMVLLTGIVDLRRHADLLEDRAPQQGLLHPVLGPGRRRLRHLRVARPLLLLLLLRARRAADVPADRRLGLEQRASRPSRAPRNTAR